MANRFKGRDDVIEPELSISAVPMDAGPLDRTKRLLTAEQRRRLLAVATRMRLPRHTEVYREGDRLTDIFIVGDGLVKSFRDLASGRRRIVAFLFPRDVFGLAEHGRYVNTTRTVIESTIYRIPLDALAGTLKRDPELQWKFLCKVTERLREAQRQTVVLGRRDAIGRVATFLKMLEGGTGKTHDTLIALPMTRTDMAEYLGLSLEAVSRATRLLTLRQIVAFTGGHWARVKDRAAFELLVTAA